MVTEHFSFKNSHLQSLEDTAFVPYLTKISILCIKVLLKELIKSHIVNILEKSFIAYCALLVIWRINGPYIYMFNTKSLFQRTVKIAKSLVKRLKFWCLCWGIFVLVWNFSFSLLHLVDTWRMRSTQPRVWKSFHKYEISNLLYSLTLSLSFVMRYWTLYNTSKIN